MSNTYEKIKKLITSGEVRVSEHGYDELVNDNLTVYEAVKSISAAVVVEDYPNYPKGPTVLLLQSDKNEQAIHVVWGIPKGHQSPAVLVTAYRPDPTQWNTSFTKRKR